MVKFQKTKGNRQIQFQPVKGTRDFLPEEMQKRQFVLDIIRQTFERWGYQPMDTPVLESFDLLAAKGGGGEEIKKEIYYFKDKGGRDLGLRFDLTVPACRIISNKLDIPMPFKRFQIGKVWRYDNPQSGRFREFVQADIDIFGCDKPEADAEIIAVVCDIFNALGFEDFVIRLNNRKLIESYIKKIGIKKVSEVFRSIDKMDKIGEVGVIKELEKKGLKKEKIREIIKFIKINGRDVLGKIKKLIWNDKLGKEGFEELETILETMKVFGYDKSVWFDMSLVRGLDYYTGPVFEVAVSGGKWSLAGGGRYDKMVESFGSRKVPGTGISIGFDRVMSIMEEQDIFRLDNLTKVFVVYVNDKVMKDALEVAQRLRREGISTDIDLSRKNLSGQLNYANSRKIPWVVFVGERELKEKKVKLRDMSCGEEKLVKLKDLVKQFT